MAKYELIAAGPTAARPILPTITDKHRTDLNKFHKTFTPHGFNRNPSLESFLNRLNLIKSYEDIPEVINVSYANLIVRNLDFKETIDIIKLSTNLAASRFGRKSKEIVITGFSAIDISEDIQKQLISAGFRGCKLSPLVSGFEAAAEAHSSWNKDHDHWSPLFTSGKIITPCSEPLKISLTYRQQQIANLITKYGMTNRQIADRLNLSDSTVKMHIGLILKKYGVQHRTQLMLSMQEKW